MCDPGLVLEPLQLPLQLLDSPSEAGQVCPDQHVAPGAGEVALRHTALGLNYIDIGMREGHYPFVKVPMAVGMEAAGLVEDVGPGVEGF